MLYLVNRVEFHRIVKKHVAEKHSKRYDCWEQDVDFEERLVTLYTRKKKNGDYTPRIIPMSDKLYDVLSMRHKNRNVNMPWVFWHRYWSKTEKCYKTGPYQDRKRLMKTLCKKADITYFRYHALRHFGASVLTKQNVSIKTIQNLLGHENQTTTEIYIHSISDSERNAIKVFDTLNDEMIEKSHTPNHTPKKEAA